MFGASSVQIGERKTARTDFETYVYFGELNEPPVAMHNRSRRKKGTITLLSLGQAIIEGGL